MGQHRQALGLVCGVADLVLRNACVMTCDPARPGLGLIERGALIAQAGEIAWVGSDTDCPRPGGRSSFGGQVMFTATAVPVLVAQDAYQKAFVARLPRIEARVRAAFRHLRCPYDRDDAD